MGFVTETPRSNAVMNMTMSGSHRLRRQSSGGSDRSSRAGSKDFSAAQPPLPMTCMAPAKWDDIKLDLEFEYSEEADGYDLVAAVPLSPSETSFETSLSEDGSTLLVEGISNPTAKEARHMQRKLAARLQRVARNYSSRVSRLQQLSDRLADEAVEAYREMGSGRFGFFSESVPIPDGVDTAALEAFIADDGLRIRMPKANSPAQRSNSL
mmetsp:Transcript_54336/g.116006  ORF Transcript_54336/g.116006 Transcript_54336/m.116006 type:complete len:210 (-) Transcript_54336:56-685(-)